MKPVSGKIDTSRGPADKAIEPILELSEDAQIRRHTLAFHARTETIVHTARWQVKFAAFLERLSVVANKPAREKIGITHEIGFSTYKA
jgi:hypothetical protein